MLETCKQIPGTLCLSNSIFHCIKIRAKGVKKFFVSSEPNEYVKNIVKQRGMKMEDLPPLVYMVEEGSDEFKNAMRDGSAIDKTPTLKEYLMDNFSADERKEIKEPKYFYSVTFEKPGGLVMPIIVEYTYADGTKKREEYPAQIWRLNDNEVSKAVASEKEIVNITVDPDLETADIDTSNNSWPKEIKQSKFDEFKSKVKN